MAHSYDTSSAKDWETWEREEEEMDPSKKLNGKALLDASIQERKEKESSVGEFTDGVRNDVREKAERLQESMGDRAKDVIGDAMREAESYAAAKNALFDTSFKVKDTEEKGAAAWNDKSDNSIAVSENAMDSDVDEGYWERVRAHEEVHKNKQAAAYDMQAVTYVDGGEEKTVDQTALVEWQATQVNVASDLTAEYAQYKADGQALADSIGDQPAVEDALKTGRLSDLQAQITEQAIKDGEDVSQELIQDSEVDVKEVLQEEDAQEAREKVLPEIAAEADPAELRTELEDLEDEEIAKRLRGEKAEAQLAMAA